jgi:hypothetical protein
MEEQEYDLTVPANKREVLKRIEKVVEERRRVRFKKTGSN